MSGGGPFRDTTRALVTHAHDQLAQLRVQRAALETSYEKARRDLDARFAASPSSDSSWRSFKTGYLVGAVMGVLWWLAILAATAASR